MDCLLVFLGKVVDELVILLHLFVVFVDPFFVLLLPLSFLLIVFLQCSLNLFLILLLEKNFLLGEVLSHFFELEVQICLENLVFFVFGFAIGARFD